jgi:hypothetical protein
VRAALLAGSVVVAGVLACGCSRQAGRDEGARWKAEIAALEARQDSLERIATSIVQVDPRIRRLPKGDVVISIPTSFPRAVIVQVFDQVVENVTLRLGGIKARVAKSVKKIVTIGEFVVDVDIQEVVGKLKPQPPDLTFADNRVAMRLPVVVDQGTGKAKVHFVWDGKNLAGLTCGDMDITETLTANVVPARYVVSGTLGLAQQGSRIVCTPRIPETKVNIRITPTKAAWATVDRILAEKQGVCGYVLEKVDVRSILKNVVEGKGFNVRLPLSKLKPFSVPAGVSDSVVVKERAIAIATRTNTLRIEPDAILYSADVAIK